MSTNTEYWYITRNVVDMWEAPQQNKQGKKPEIVSSAIMSEPISILERSGKWVKIATIVDGYQGWVQDDRVCKRETSFPDAQAITARVNRCAGLVYAEKDTVYGPMMTLYFETKLEVVDQQDPRWLQVALPDGKTGYIQRGHVCLTQERLTFDKLEDFTKKFLGLPYRWGGRSSKGYDCSGFVQMVFRQMGIFLPRDAKDQIRWEGFSPVALDSLVTGDAIYFGLDKDTIRHAGLYLNDGRFIHSTVAENEPMLRISELPSPEWKGEGRFKFVAARRVIV